MSAATISYLLPEIILVLAGTLIFLIGAFAPRATMSAWLGAGSVLLAALVLVAEGSSGEASAPAFADGLATYFRGLTLALGFLFLLLSARPAAGPHGAEMIGSLLLVLAGVMLVASAQDLVLLFVGLELVSIPTYVLLSLGRRDLTDQEVAAKYLLLSILASAMLLYGFSFLYGLGGSTRLAAIQAHLDLAEAQGFRPLAVMALVLIFAGLAFRLAAVPFHFYAPDVYQGTSFLNAALLSVAPKLAGTVVLVRVLTVSLPNVASFGWMVALMLALLSMTLGNVVALWQNNLRRLMAYSSIAHAGYLLIGVTVAFALRGGAEVPPAMDGVGSVVFYLTVYSLATIGVFAALAYVGDRGRRLETLDDLAGLARLHPGAALAMAVGMFSLAGIPPLAGFWGKLALFAAALGVEQGSIEHPLGGWFVGLAVAGVLNAAIAAAYYLRWIGAMYFRALESRPTSQSRLAGGAALAMALATVAVLWIGLRPGPILEAANALRPSAVALPEAPLLEAPLRASRPEANLADVF